MKRKIDNSEVHNRWMERRNRRQENADYLDKWRVQQCLHCAFYIPLTGVLGEDYGACTNAVSPFDKFVMFEHDGCDHHIHCEATQ